MKRRISCGLVVVVSLGFAAGGAGGAEPVKAGTPAKNPAIVFSTSLGDITVELFAEQAPITVKNILDYVDAGFYDGTIFHRVIPGFVVQGGGMTPKLDQKKTQPPIKNEADNGLKNTRGTLSMARTDEVNSATSQFFINLRDNTSLDHGVRGFGYAVFGKVTAGMDVVDKIAAVRTGSQGGQRDVPVEPVVVRSVKRQ